MLAKWKLTIGEKATTQKEQGQRPTASSSLCFRSGCMFMSVCIYLREREMGGAGQKEREFCAGSMPGAEPHAGLTLRTWMEIAT